MFGVVLSAIIFAFLIGLLARWALPGPDPMPVWLTTAIGLIASTIGWAIVIVVHGGDTRDTSWAGLASLCVAVALVIAYRRFVQKRPLWGRGAHRFPERGFGVENYRERLRKVGIDPDEIGVDQPLGVARASVGVPTRAAQDHPGEPTENPAYYLRLLDELHDSDVLDDSEYDGARARLIDKLR